MLSAGTGHHPAKHFVCHTCLHPSSGESHAVYLYNSQSAVHHFGEKHGSNFAKRGPGRAIGARKHVVMKVDSCVQQNAPSRTPRAKAAAPNALGRAQVPATRKRSFEQQRHMATVSASATLASSTSSIMPTQLPQVVSHNMFPVYTTLASRQNDRSDIPEDSHPSASSFYLPPAKQEDASAKQEDASAKQEDATPPSNDELSDFDEVYDNVPDWDDAALNTVITKDNAATYSIPVWEEKHTPTPTTKPTPTTSVRPSLTSSAGEALAFNLTELLQNLPKVGNESGVLATMRQLLKQGLGMVDEIEQLGTHSVDGADD